MIADQGVILLAINLEARKVLVEGPDSRQQLCDVVAWWQNGDPPKRCESPIPADYFTFEVLGFTAGGEPCEVRYDARLEGVGPPIKRNEDGSFGTKAAAKLNEQFKANAARLPAVFDGEGR